MASRRMTSLEVIDTDAFLDMPMSSQLLYFHLNARADDDGFVANPKKVLRTLGGSSDDYKVLISKKFLIEFEDGVCVIKHWRINNFIRKDLYKETKYLDLKSTLFIRANGAYTQSDDGTAIPVPKGHFILEDVNERLTDSQLRIGKGREESAVAIAPADIQVVRELSEESERPQKKETYPNARKVFKWFPEIDPAWGINSTELKAGVMLFDKGEEKVRKNIKYCAENIGTDGFPIPRLTPYLLITNWQRIYEYSQRG